MSVSRSILNGVFLKSDLDAKVKVWVTAWIRRKLRIEISVKVKVNEISFEMFVIKKEYNQGINGLIQDMFNANFVAGKGRFVYNEN